MPFGFLLWVCNYVNIRFPFYLVCIYYCFLYFFLSFISVSFCLFFLCPLIFFHSLDNVWCFSNFVFLFMMVWFYFIFFLLLCSPCAKANVWPFLSTKISCFNLALFREFNQLVCYLLVTLLHFLPEFLNFYFVILLQRGNCFNELFLIPGEMLSHNFHLFHSNTLLVRIVHFLSNFAAIFLGYFCFNAL